MSFLDIFLKLFPFFYFDENKQLHFGWPLEDADRLITVFVLGLIALAIYFGIKLGKSVRRERRLFVSFEAILRKYQGQFAEHLDDDMTEEIKQLNAPRISVAWEEFQKHLVRGRNFFNQPELRSVVGAEYFFNSTNLVSRAGSKLYSAVPSILLGIGLIGTFFGLYYGLMRVDFKDAASMQVLLQAAGAKFVASIWGLVLSLVFTGYEKNKEQKLDEQLVRIQNLINHEIPRQLSEQSLVELEIYASEQRDQLNSLSLNIAEALGEKITASLVDNLLVPIQNMARNLGGTPENTLYDRLSVLAGGIGDNFSRNMDELLRNVIKEISSTVGADADKLKQTLQSLEESLAGLKATFESQQKQMSDNTSHHLKTLGESIKTMTEGIENQNRELKQSLAGLSHTMSEQTSELSQSLSVLSLQMNRQSEVLEQSIEKIAQGAQLSQQNITDSSKNVVDLLNQQAGKVSEQIEGKATEALGRIEQTMLDQAKHFETALAGLKVQMTEQSHLLKEVVDEIGKNAGIANEKLASGSQAAFIQIQQALQDVRETITDSQKKLQDIPDHLERFHTSTQTLDNMADSTKDASLRLQQVVEGLQDSQSKWHSAIQQSITSFAQSLSTFGGSLSSQEQQLSRISQQLNTIVRDTQNVCQQLASSYEEIIGTNSESAQQLREQLDGYLSAFIQKIKNIQDEMNQRCEDSYAQMSEHFQDALAKLEQPLESFGKAVSDACSELNDSIHELSVPRHKS